MPIKSTPLDIETFRQETSVKYPTFSATSTPVPLSTGGPQKIEVSILTSKLSQAYSPIPIRHHYHHDELDSNSGLPPSSSNLFHGQPLPNGPYRPQPATPAPSPPPSPKPKKQQYQTDQTRPFLFPFSKSNRFGKDAKYVPFAISEADKLYTKHMYISLALLQMWKTREDCMIAESGLERMPGSDPNFGTSTFNPSFEVCTCCFMYAGPHH